MSQQNYSIKIKDDRPAKVYSFKAELSAEQVGTLQMWLIALEEVWNIANAAKDTQRLILHIRKQHGGEVAPSAIWQDDVNDLLSAIRAKKWWPEDSIQRSIPTEIRAGLIDTLKKAWGKYYDDRKKGILTGRPKPKSSKRPVQSLINLNGKTTVKVSHLSEHNALVSFRGLEPFKVKGYYKRFPGGLEYGKVALVQDGGEWFIQFTARYTPAEVVRPVARQMGVDPGIKAVVATSEGQVIKPRRNPIKLRQRLKRLQRKQARQQKGSASSQKTRAAINRVHAKIRRQRKGFNVKLADWLGRFDVAFEGSRLGNMTRRAKPKHREDGKGYERNGAKAKSGLNRELLDNGLGQVRQLTEVRCKSRRHKFVKTAQKDVSYSSQRCHCCAELGVRPSQEKFVCLNRDCRLYGTVQHADVNAAKNHAIAGFNLPREATSVQLGEVMPVESGATSAGQPGGRSKVALLPEASSTTPEPCNGQPQGSMSVKDTPLPFGAETQTIKATQPLTSRNLPCTMRSKGSEGQSAETKAKKRGRSKVLASNAETPV